VPRNYSKRAIIDPEIRFWSKVDKDGPIPNACPELGPCWLWAKSKLNGGGYGSFWDGKRVVPAHRFAFVTYNGPIDDDMDVDHICHNRQCVRPTHLRPATLSENQRNSCRPKNNKSGFKGVSRPKGRRKWTAQITVDDQTKYIGTFDTPKEAHTAYCEAATRLHGEFANFGDTPL
jgi:hypothetical protein